MPGTADHDYQYTQYMQVVCISTRDIRFRRQVLTGIHRYIIDSITISEGPRAQIIGEDLLLRAAWHLGIYGVEVSLSAIRRQGVRPQVADLRGLERSIRPGCTP